MFTSLYRNGVLFFIYAFVYQIRIKHHYVVLGAVLGAEDTMRRKMAEISALVELTVRLSETDKLTLKHHAR